MPTKSRFCWDHLPRASVKLSTRYDSHLPFLPMCQTKKKKRKTPNLLLMGLVPEARWMHVVFSQSFFQAHTPSTFCSKNAWLHALTQKGCVFLQVRVTTNWNKTVSRLLDKRAEESLKKLMERGCHSEACKGFVCAEYFPRCFLVDATTQVRRTSLGTVYDAPVIFPTLKTARPTRTT